MKYNAVTVTQLNKYLKDRFDEDENLTAILVKGEISNFKNHYTGHLYFTLKDELHRTSIFYIKRRKFVNKMYNV